MENDLQSIRANVLEVRPGLTFETALSVLGIEVTENEILHPLVFLLQRLHPNIVIKHLPQRFVIPSNFDFLHEIRLGFHGDGLVEFGLLLDGTLLLQLAAIQGIRALGMQLPQGHLFVWTSCFSGG